jgi:predicted MFS family arabinose efflux permease
MADIVEAKDRTRYFALMMGVVGAAMIMGPFLGGVLADPSLVSWFTAATPFWFAAILAGLNTAFLIFLLPETNANRRTQKLDLADNLRNLSRAYVNPELGPIFLSVFFVGLSSGFFVSFFGVFLTKKFGFDESQIGHFLAYCGVWVLVTQFITTPVVAKRIGESKVLRVTLLAEGVLLGLYLLPMTSSWWIFVIGPGISTFAGLSIANLVGLISRTARDGEQGQAMGIFGSIFAFGIAIPPLAGGFVAMAIDPAGVIAMAAVAQFLSGVVFVWAQRSRSSSAA